MLAITSKSVIKDKINQSSEILRRSGYSEFVKFIDEEILDFKIRFPLLEYAADLLFNVLKENDSEKFILDITTTQKIGAYVIAGILLRKKILNDPDDATKKACDIIISGDMWYVCDIVGERVLGYLLLKNPETGLKTLTELGRSKDKWLVRVIGVAGHYAIKNGLQKKDCASLFDILLKHADVTDFHTKKGIGWAAKTLAKFHPDIIGKRMNEINSSKVKTWFKTKIKIGLGRSAKYALRYSA